MNYIRAEIIPEPLGFDCEPAHPSLVTLLVQQH